jgi:hypothetical protein
MTNWMTRAFIVVCLVLIASAIFRILTPHSSPIPQTVSTRENYDGSFTSFSGVAYTGSEIEVPRSFEIHAVTPAVSVDQLTSQLVAQLGLSPHPQIAHFYSNDLYTLAKSGAHDWTLTLNTESDVESLNVPSAQAAATSFVEQYFPGFTFQPLDADIEYLRNNGSHYDPSTPEQATAVYIPFAQVIDEIPIYQMNSSIAPVGVWVNGSNTVIKVTLTPPLYTTGESTAQLASISLEEAVRNINRSQGSIIQSTQDVFGPIELGEIVSANLSVAAVEYRIDPELQIAYPFYRFTGTALNMNNTRMEVQIITPAVATTTR